MHEWLADVLTGGNRTLSGETISPSSAMGLSAYYAAIRAISEDCGKLPLLLYQRLDAGGKKRLVNDPIYRLIHDEPNPEMSSQTFRETLTQHAMGWGGGFAEIQLRGDRPVALWPLDPARVRLERDKQSRKLRYVVTDTYRTEHEIAPRRMFHVHGLGFDGLTGYSVAKVAKQSLGLAMAEEKSGAAYFGNGARPGGVLTTPNQMSPEAKQKLAEQWNKAHQGVDCSHKVTVLEDGMTFSAINIPNEDAQWIESRQFSVEEVCRWFRIPPHKLQHLLRSTFNNISHQAIEYVQDTLLAWLNRWEAEIWRKLIPRPDQDAVFAEHLVEGLLRGDTESRFKAYQQAIQSGWMNRNEARELENMNPEDGLDVFLEPQNMRPAGEEVEEAEPPAPTPDNTEFNADPLIWAQMGVMSEAYTRLLKIAGNQLERAVKRGGVEKWEARFFDDHVEAARDTFSGPLWAFAGSLWASATGQPAPGVLRQIAANHAAEAAMRHVEKSRRRVETYRESKGTATFDKRDDAAAREELRSLAARIQPLIQQR
jgi:HK97 family phage portal protein